MKTNIQIKRIYEPKTAADGCRVLVDRIWPRGVKRDDAKIDCWMKDLGPSHELRKWFDHQEERWGTFVEQYLEELKSVEAQRMLKELSVIASGETLTLLYSAKNQEYNQAIVIARALRQIQSNVSVK